MSSRPYRRRCGGRERAGNSRQIEVVLPSQVVTENLPYGPTGNSFNTQGIHITLAKNSRVKLSSCVTLASYLPHFILVLSSVKCSTIFLIS